MKSFHRTLWLALLTAHATAAILWWWEAPVGFPWRGARQWTNQVLPWAVVAIAIIARLAMRLRPRLGAASMLTIPTAWATAAIVARVAFPITFRLLWLVPFVVGAMLLVLWLASCRRMTRWRSFELYICGVVAIAIGCFIPLSQRGAPPGTRPLNLSASPGQALETTRAQGSIRLHDHVQVETGHPWVSIAADRYALGVQPVLTFVSRSPDRCWTLFAPESLRDGPGRRFTGIAQSGSSLELTYSDDGESHFRIEAARPAITSIESSTTLGQEVYTHLNTFCELTLIGHSRLFLSFSPCPAWPIEVTYMEYPRGRPERLAYLDSRGEFHVVEACSAEKGPYRELARGRLDPREALTITLLDEERPIFAITLDDWAAQSSVALSPTAGHGLPENAIEFSVAGLSPSSTASIFITLAATSVGRGYDSVGHAAGTYRNRMRVVRLIP